MRANRGATAYEEPLPPDVPPGLSSALLERRPDIREAGYASLAQAPEDSESGRAKFHTELHKLRKTGASRRYLAGIPLPTLMLELGLESLAVTQDYLADVRKPGEAKKAVADADFVPKPKVVKTGTDSD